MKETALTAASGVAPLDVEAVRRDFPILSREVRGKPLAYLDNAATSQKPAVVIETLERYYREMNANIHRGIHYLSQAATDEHEAARERVRQFLNAPAKHEIVFVRGTTEAINLVAQSFVRPRVGEGDEILITEMEHHANIVPWQLVCQQTGATLRVAPISDAGELDEAAFEGMIGPRTRMVAIGHVSNSLGTIYPVERLVAMAKAQGVPVLVDGAQATPHTRVDVQALGCDFYAFSGHKVFGPTGIGCLWGRTEHLEAMPPYQGGGDMISQVTFEKSEWNELPYKFEAGTPDIGGAIALRQALDYVDNVGLERIAAYEHELLEYATNAVSEIEGLTIIGRARNKASIVSFVMEGMHPQDIGTILDHEGVAVRTGHHCTMPIMTRFGIPGTVRASFAFYNTREEVDRFVQAIHTARMMLG